MGEVIHVLNIMKCMDSDIMYIINVYNDIWNATYCDYYYVQFAIEINGRLRLVSLSLCVVFSVCCFIKKDGFQYCKRCYRVSMEGYG